MAKYRKIDPRIWNDKKFRALSDAGKLAFLFALTHPHMTALGAMRTTLPGLASEIGWTEKAFREAIGEAFAKGMAKHDSEASFLWLPNFLKYNAPESPNVVKAWVDSLDLLPECQLKLSLIQHVKAFAEGLTEGFAKALPHAFAKGMPYQEQEQEQEQEQDLGSPSDSVPHGGTGNGGGETRAGQQTAVESSEAVARVFSHWRQEHNHPRAQLDEQRRKIIRAALKGYSEADLCLAISGYLNSPHHMGENDRGTRYDDIELFLRDAKHIDAGLRYQAEPPRTGLSAKSRRIVSQTEDWVPPEERHASN